MRSGETSRTRGSATYASYERLGGIGPSVEELAEEVSRLPLDGLLGSLGYISTQHVRAAERAYQNSFQSEYLVRSVLDDFPRELPAISRWYTAGQSIRIPGPPILVHERNLAWLAHTALLHAIADADTPELSKAFQQRVCRLLLIGNDRFADGVASTPITGTWDLVSRRELALRFLRESQFEQFQHGEIATVLSLARQKLLFCDILPRVWPDAPRVFEVATGGISLARYFEILGLIIVHVYRLPGAPGNQWFQRSIASSVGAAAGDVERVMGTWITTPAEYRRRHAAWVSARGSSGVADHYDYVTLRRTPFILVRGAEMVCPVVQLLFAKMIDEPYFLFSEQPEGAVFQTKMGDVYEEYASGLISRVVEADARRWWRVERNPGASTGRELADTYIQSGNVAFAFEHKAKRPDTDFLRGGPGDRVMGPVDSVLEKLERGEAPNACDPRDEGLLSQGMRQQTDAALGVLAWARAGSGVEPREVFHVISHLAALRVGEEPRRLLLEPVIERARFYAHPSSRKPQWLRVSDLEHLAAAAEEYGIDIVALFRKKRQTREAEAFDVFLYEELGGLPAERKLGEVAKRILEDAIRTFFPQTA